VTEEVFQAALDADPDDHATRAVFADFLEERGDERAAGMRWLAENKRRPQNWRDGRSDDWMWSLSGGSPREACAKLEDRPDIFAALMGRPGWHKRNDKAGVTEGMGPWVSWRTRREAEDALCLAYHEARKAVTA
jgi:uncharacterized protein (TIGR02996 family)